jgi:hypothetical protein
MRLVGARNLVRDEPAVATRAGLAAIEAAVDENPCEPYFEGPGLPIRGDVGEHLDERILDRFVGFPGIAEILIGDAGCPALVQCDQFAESFTCFVGISPLDERPDLDGDSRIIRDRGLTPFRTPRKRRNNRLEVGRIGLASVSNRPDVTHRALRCGVRGVYSLL